MSAVNPASPEFPEQRSRLYRYLVRAEIVVAVILLVALLTLVSLQVFTRFVLHAPLVWTEELARFTFVWFVFVGATFVTARRRQIVVQLYRARGSGRVMSFIDAFAAVVSVVATVILAVGSVELMQHTSRLVLPASNIPQSVFYASAVVGFTLVAFHSAVNVVLALRYPAQYVRQPQLDLEVVD